MNQFNNISNLPPTSLHAAQSHTQSTHANTLAPPNGQYTDDLLQRCITQYAAIKDPTPQQLEDLTRWRCKMRRVSHRSLTHPCPHCWMRFEHLNRHYTVNCNPWLTERNYMLTIVSENRLYSAPAEPTSTASTTAVNNTVDERICSYHTNEQHSNTLLPLWCTKHHICTTCTNSPANLYHSQLLMCSHCNTPAQLDHENATMFTIRRRANDCGLVVVNAIIDCFLISTSKRRTYISHDKDMRVIIRNQRKRFNAHEMYELHDLELALETQDFTSVPWQAHSQLDLPQEIPQQVLAFLIRPEQEHYYAYIRHSPTQWKIFDSTYGIISTILLCTTDLQHIMKRYIVFNDQCAIKAIINSSRCYNDGHACERGETFCKSGTHLLCSNCATRTTPTDSGTRTSANLCICNYIHSESIATEHMELQM